MIYQMYELQDQYVGEYICLMALAQSILGRAENFSSFPLYCAYIICIY